MNSACIYELLLLNLNLKSYQPYSNSAIRCSYYCECRRHHFEQLPQFCQFQCSSIASLHCTSLHHHLFHNFSNFVQKKQAGQATQGLFLINLLRKPLPFSSLPFSHPAKAVETEFIVKQAEKIHPSQPEGPVVSLEMYLVYREFKVNRKWNYSCWFQ